METLHLLNQQMEQLRKKADEQLQLKEQEAYLMVRTFMRILSFSQAQEYEASCLESERTKLKRLQHQENVRKDLDSLNNAKRISHAKAKRESLEMDISIVSKFAEMAGIEREEKQQRKLQLNRELHAYMDYLHRRVEEQKQEEQGLDQLHRVENERMWQQRELKWRAEEEARSKLMDEVLRQRQDQLHQKSLTI